MYVGAGSVDIQHTGYNIETLPWPFLPNMLLLGVCAGFKQSLDVQI